MARQSRFKTAPLATALLTLAGTASAQTETLPSVVLKGRADPVLSIGGFGDTPLSRTPLQASVIGAEQLRDAGALRLADLTRLDPAVGDAYNAEGYWDFLSIRGFVLDQRFNYRRDGLPINAETSIPLDNKERIEILKGLSGMQAGTSVPGGLVNHVVKRPSAAPLRSARLEWRQSGSVLGAVDLSQRFGEGERFGMRLNALAEHLDPRVRSQRGQRELLALAGDWRLAPGTLLEAELEHSHRSQPSVPGFSLLGSQVPEARTIDPRINLNNLPWSLPVVMDGDTASLRLTQRLSEAWSFTAHAAAQRLHSDDRIAFPFGCFAEGNFDRYCSDGSFDLYDFRSEKERRRSDALDLALRGRLRTGAVEHALSTGLLGTWVRNRFQPQAFNFAGGGSIDGTAVTPSAPDAILPSTNRDERSTEFYLRDEIRLSERAGAWLGLRHTRLSRRSVGTDGSSPTDYRQSFTTPWMAASYAVAPEQTVYLSWGRGVESEVVPNLPFFTNRGQALPSLKSRQLEVGLKGSNDRLEWGLAWFDIERPLFADSCDADGNCTRALDGQARHRGLEADAALRAGAWTLRGGMQLLRARREGSAEAAHNGLKPTNVPERTLKAQAGYALSSIAGLVVQGGLVHESRRMVLPDNSVSIPGQTRVDLGARLTRRNHGSTLIWRAGIDNLFDRRGWREAPFQFGHAYLFPQAPRTLRLSLQVDL